MLSLEKEEQLETLLKAEENLVLDFFAEWCPPCKRLIPVLETISKDQKFKEIKFVKINISLFGNLSRKYNITSIPTLILLSKKRKEERLMGFIDKKELSSILEKFFF